MEQWLSTRGTVHVLSPHVDDAVYSLGGWIATATRPVVIHNIFSETRFTAAGPRRDAGLIRRREEGAAMDVLAPAAVVECRYHGLADLSARGPGDSRAKLERQVAEVIRAIGVDPLDGWLVPAGVGAHPDHLLVATAARPLEAIAYCEIPYILWDQAGVGRATHALAVDVERHLAAMGCFESQVDPSLEWRAPMRDALLAIDGLPVIAACFS